MNEHAEQWVAALRSGEFEQTQGALRSDQGHCCLGVGCETYRRATGNGEWVFDPEAARYAFDVHGAERNVTVLPDRVREWLGLRDELGTCDGDSLATLNDDGATFARIADRIESEPEGLFVGEAG